CGEAGRMAALGRIALGGGPPARRCPSMAGPLKVEIRPPLRAGSPHPPASGGLYYKPAAMDPRRGPFHETGVQGRVIMWSLLRDLRQGKKVGHHERGQRSF